MSDRQSAENQPPRELSPEPAPAGPPPPPAAGKDELRSWWRARRRALSPHERTTQSADLTEHVLGWYLPRARHRRVAVVLSYGTEPDTDPLREALHQAGVEVLAPVTEPGRQMSWSVWHPGVDVERSSVAPIDEPVGERLGVETMAAVDLVLVPAQAVDRRGYRMGQGGGYYDRFLAALRQEVDQQDDFPMPVTVAMVFRHELLADGDELPASEHDEPVDGAVTADGFTWFGPAPS
ncbi:5-formyltetrahydrofolate cyclo-ligase [Citricoccus sp. GCM10030269]|uniref:5-formyltetrahydrofolate cyclo-ligase n=1 Tax=Citricoccus sp. GCM10030269 TaxID=3273388 RepID=UPI00360830FF